MIEVIRPGAYKITGGDFDIVTGTGGVQEYLKQLRLAAEKMTAQDLIQEISKKYKQ